MSQIDDMRTLAATMRELGIRRARMTSDGIEVELGPVPVPVAPPAREERPEPAPVCACGHPHDEHNEIGCLNGCSLERCAGSGQHPQPEGV